MTPLALHFAVEVQDSKVYYDPAANCHSDVVAKFNIPLNKIVSRGWVVDRWYVQRARHMELISPNSAPGQPQAK